MGPVLLRREESTITLMPSLSKTISDSFGSSRANLKEGPPQPISDKKTLMADAVLFSLKYSSNHLFALSINSTMTSLSFLVKFVTV